jgi:hypothetical protein
LTVVRDLGCSSFNDWHLPTGWVPIEEIIRFCIVDLGVPPLDTSVDADGNPGWHTRLVQRSYDE